MSNANVPAKVAVWKIGGASGNLRSMNTCPPNQGYHLFGTQKSQCLTYHSQKYGINLGWVDESPRSAHFRTPDGQEREIRSGELLALAVGNEDKSFLYYAHRDIGINLNWSKEPIYEWRVFRADGQLDVPIPADTLVAIRNEKGDDPNPDFLIWYDRVLGCNLGWPSTPGVLEHAGDVAKDKGVSIAKNQAKHWLGLP